MAGTIYLVTATRALMSAQRRNPSAEYRRRLSEAQKGRTFSAETIEKIGIGNQGKIVSEETKQKLSIAAKLQWKKIKGEA